MPCRWGPSLAPKEADVPTDGRQDWSAIPSPTFKTAARSAELCDAGFKVGAVRFTGMVQRASVLYPSCARWVTFVLFGFMWFPSFFALGVWQDFRKGLLQTERS